MGRLMGAAVVVMGILLGALVLIWSLQRRLIYFPIGDVPAPDVVGLAGATRVSFSTRDRLMLGGWFIAEARPAMPETEFFARCGVCIHEA